MLMFKFKTIIILLTLMVIKLPFLSIAQRTPKNKSKISEEDIILSLEIHNNARKDVGTPPLKWSIELANDAQKYADYLAWRNRGLIHSKSRRDQGENLYMVIRIGNSSSITEYPGREASARWYREIKNYRYSKIRLLPFFKKWKLILFRRIGHYTQMIWESTTEVGIGWSISKSGHLYVVARYSPAGNNLWKFPY